MHSLVDFPIKALIISMTAIIMVSFVILNISMSQMQQFNDYVNSSITNNGGLTGETLIEIETNGNRNGDSSKTFTLFVPGDTVAQNTDSSNKITYTKDAALVGKNVSVDYAMNPVAHQDPTTDDYNYGVFAREFQYKYSETPDSSKFYSSDKTNANYSSNPLRFFTNDSSAKAQPNYTTDSSLVGKGVGLPDPDKVEAGLSSIKFTLDGTEYKYGEVKYGTTVPFLLRGQFYSWLIGYIRESQDEQMAFKMGSANKNWMTVTKTGSAVTNAFNP